MTVLTCARADLAWALKAVLPHACKDKVIGSLCGVRVEIVPGDKTMFVVATDRYTIGAAKVAFDGDHEPVQVTMPSAEVRDLLRKLPAGKDAPPVALTVTSQFVLLDNFYRFHVMPDIQVPGQDSGTPWVDWRSLLGKMLRNPPGVPGPGYGYNSAYLGRFATAGRGGTANGVTVMPLTTGARRASMTVVLAENFAGAAMGAQLNGALNAPAVLRRWRELLPKEAAS